MVPRSVVNIPAEKIYQTKLLQMKLKKSPGK